MNNPQAFQKLQNLIRNTNDPQQFLNQIISGYTPEQRNQFIKFANDYGVSEEQLNKYGINSK